MTWATRGVTLRQSKWWYFGSLLWTVAAVFSFAAFAGGGSNNPLVMGTVAVVFAVLFFYLGRRDAG